MKEDTEAHLWEIFLTAIQDFEVHGNVPFSAYAKSKIHYGEMNLFRSLCRQWQKEIVPMEDEENHASPVESFPSDHNTELAVLIPWEEEDLRRSVEQLPDLQKYIIKEIFFENKSIAHLARECGISRQAMHKHYKRALIFLQNKLEQSI